MNLSETAFVVPRSASEWDLRWFTPTVEVDLCGHATLGVGARPLGGQAHRRERPVTFHTRSGALAAARDDPGSSWTSRPRPAIAGDVPSEIADTVGGAPTVTAHGNVGGGMSGYFLEYASEGEVRALKPDFSRLGRIEDGYVIATAAASMDGYDFVSRFFATPAGIDEDPVTGSAHCTLGPWWAGQARQGRAHGVPVLGSRRHRPRASTR